MMFSQTGGNMKTLVSASGRVKRTARWKRLLGKAALLAGLTLVPLYFGLTFYQNLRIKAAEKICEANSVSDLEQRVRENIDGTLLKEEGLIAFVSNRSGNDEIYLMNYSGANQKRLTFNTTFDGDPAISPDKKQIAYASCENGNLDIFLMDLYGLVRQQITTDASNEKNPEWSPCGTYLLFETDRRKNWDIYKIDLIERNISSFRDRDCSENNPKISPNGLFVAYSESNEGRICNSKGHEARYLGHDLFSPFWEKDSSFCNFTNDPNVIMVYTPLGDRIVFNKKVGGFWQIFIKNNQTGIETQLTNTSSNNYMPDCR